MKRKNKQTLVQLTTEFAKLQLAGNIPFWGTYFGYAALNGVMHMSSFYALAIPTVLSNILFFIVDDKWVFTRRGNRKSQLEIIKFIIFMSFSAGMIFLMTYSLEQFFSITPYIGQFISSLSAAIWNFLGLRFWVFSPPKHHALKLVLRKPRRHKPRTA